MIMVGVLDLKRYDMVDRKKLFNICENILPGTLVAMISLTLGSISARTAYRYWDRYSSSTHMRNITIRSKSVSCIPWPTTHLEKKLRPPLLTQFTGPGIL